MEKAVKQLPVPSNRKGMKANAGNWLRRFLPAEIAGTLTAVAASQIVYRSSGNPVAAAFAGSIGETLGFYTIIIIRDTLAETRKLRAVGKKSGLITWLRLLKNILIDFGPAELLDSFLVRPSLMYLFPLWISNYSLGILAGKFASDAVFYIPVIITYEWRIRRAGKSRRKEH